MTIVILIDLYIKIKRNVSHLIYPSLKEPEAAIPLRRRVIGGAIPTPLTDLTRPRNGAASGPAAVAIPSRSPEVIGFRLSLRQPPIPFAADLIPFHKLPQKPEPLSPDWCVRRTSP